MKCLVDCGKGKYFFQSVNSMIDFIITDDLYVYHDPTVYKLNDGIFDPLMKITYRGAESAYHNEGQPQNCDAFTYDMWTDKHGYQQFGWMDKYQGFIDFRNAVKQYASDLGDLAGTFFYAGGDTQYT